MQQDRKPNWTKWRHVPVAEIWEAVALSLNIDPGQVHWSLWVTGDRTFDEPKEFQDRLVTRCNIGQGTVGIPPESTVALAEFAAWALSMRWDVPPEFAELAPADAKSYRAGVVATGVGKGGKGDIAPMEKPLGERERGTLLKLVLGMALGGYGYDPKAARSPVPKDIADDLQRRGISLTDDTVRVWLKTAADEVEWNPLID